MPCAGTERIGLIHSAVNAIKDLVWLAAGRHLNRKVFDVQDVSAAKTNIHECAV